MEVSILSARQFIGVRNDGDDPSLECCVFCLSIELHLCIAVSLDLIGGDDIAVLETSRQAADAPAGGLDAVR